MFYGMNDLEKRNEKSVVGIFECSQEKIFLDAKDVLRREGKRIFNVNNL